MNNPMELFRVKFATFNIGDFSGTGFETGSEEAKAAIRGTMNSVNAAVWALQEDTEFFGETGGLSPCAAVYDCCKNYVRRGTGRYNYKAFLANDEIRDAEQIFYTGNMFFRHPWFLCASVTLGGRDIRLINLHFDWSDKNVRAGQITQVLAYASKYPYCIIMGDFNPEDYIDDGKRLSTDLLYEREFARFTDAGYTLANGGKFGTFDTILDTETTPCPFDNIIVSGNITIESAGRTADPWMNDHALIWAELLIR